MSVWEASYCDKLGKRLTSQVHEGEFLRKVNWTEFDIFIRLSRSQKRTSGVFNHDLSLPASVVLS